MSKVKVRIYVAVGDDGSWSAWCKPRIDRRGHTRQRRLSAMTFGDVVELAWILGHGPSLTGLGSQRWRARWSDDLASDSSDRLRRYGVALRSEAAVSALGIWFIERTDEYGYDEYDSAVVYAETDDEARGDAPQWVRRRTQRKPTRWTTLEHVKVTRIGTAWDGAMKGSYARASTLDEAARRPRRRVLAAVIVPAASRSRPVDDARRDARMRASEGRTCGGEFTPLRFFGWVQTEVDVMVGLSR